MIASAVATRPAVVGSIATCSGVSASLAQRAFGLRAARQFRRARKRADELGLEPRAARSGEQPLDAFAGIEHDEVGRQLDEALDPGDDRLRVRSVVDADERAAQHARAAALEQARQARRAGAPPARRRRGRRARGRSRRTACSWRHWLALSVRCRRAPAEPRRRLPLCADGLQARELDDDAGLNAVEIRGRGCIGAAARPARCRYARPRSTATRPA